MIAKDREPIITLSQVNKTFGQVTALRDVSFSIPRNTVYGVLGPNGAGKTTLFSIISGFIAADSGVVTTLGETNPEKLKGKLGILPQDALFQANIPIIDQLSFFLQLLGYSRRAAWREVMRVLHLVELDTVLYREAATLSHGMYKRLALAQAFLGEPEIIILDEPTSGLDSSGGRKIRDTILALKEEKTLVVSSHNLEEMQHLCDHIAILDNGELVSSGPIDEITGLSQSVTVLLSRELDPEEQQRITGIVHIRECEHVSANTYRLTFDPHVSAEEIDTSMGQFQHLLIDSGITLRSLEKDNLIESVYRGLTGGG